MSDEKKNFGVIFWLLGHFFIFMAIFFSINSNTLVGLIDGQSVDLPGPLDIPRKPILSAEHLPSAPEVQNLFEKCTKSIGPQKGLLT